MESAIKLQKFAKSILKECKKKKDQEGIETWKRVLELNKEYVKNLREEEK